MVKNDKQLTIQDKKKGNSDCSDEENLMFAEEPLHTFKIDRHHLLNLIDKQTEWLAKFKHKGWELSKPFKLNDTQVKTL